MVIHDAAAVPAVKRPKIAFVTASREDHDHAPPPRCFRGSTSLDSIESRVASELLNIKSSLLSGLREIDLPYAVSVASNPVFDEPALRVLDRGKPSPFVVEKVLETSDVGSLCRLMLNKKAAESDILPLLDNEEKALIISGKGCRFSLYDLDTMSFHSLNFKRWGSSKCYIFNNNWTLEFVKRRGLKAGDTIGLYWDDFYDHFCFSVLNRAS